MRGKLDDLIETLEENPDLNEIDYAYVMFGVPLNVREQASREYLYRFFDKCRLQQTSSNAEYLLQQQAHADYNEALTTWNTWKAAQADPADPLYGTAEPPYPSQPGSVGSQVQIKAMARSTLTSI